MTLSEAKALLQSHSIQFQEMEFANEAEFFKHIHPYPCVNSAKENPIYALIIHSANGKKHIELQFEKKEKEYVFWDLWFGDFCFEYFEYDEDGKSLIEHICEIMEGNQVFIVVNNPKTKRWIADAQYDKADSDDDMFGEVGFQKALTKIRKKKTFFERMFGFSRSYEIYDWNTYECIVK